MEWSDFQTRAVNDVTEGYRSKAPSDQRLLQVLIIPPLEAVSSTELFAKQTGTLFVAQKIWNRAHDLEKYQSSSSAFRRLRYFTPTIETYTMRIDKERADNILNLFRTLHLSIWVQDEQGKKNEVRYQVTLETSSTCVQFQWMSSTVAAWSELDHAAAQFVEVVKGLMDQKS
jgi:hypothetical protein